MAENQAGNEMQKQGENMTQQEKEQAYQQHVEIGRAHV